MFVDTRGVGKVGEQRSLADSPDGLVRQVALTITVSKSCSLGRKETGGKREHTPIDDAQIEPLYTSPVGKYSSRVLASM